MRAFLKEVAASPQRIGFFTLILTVALLARTLGLSNPKDLYFDEVYHGYTALEYVHHNRDTYDPWAKPPEGKANEWTHPPLAKLGMAVMIKVFGENSFGWRIGSAISGVGSVFMIGVFAFVLFEHLGVALLAMAFLALENLNITQSRIAMNDSYLVFFMLVTMTCYVRFRKPLAYEPRYKWLYLSGFFLGLCFGTKWTAFYVLGALGLDGILSLFDYGVLRKNKFSKLFLHVIAAFVLLPGAIYLLSYLHYFSFGFTWTQFKELQWQMWHYHTGLTATHSYQSRPWQWIFNLKPVWMFVNYIDGNRVRNIYNTGNSIILVYGFFAALFALLMPKSFLKSKFSWQRRFLLLCYFLLWVPWIFSPRIMLFYHYMPATPFLMVLLAAHVWWEKRGGGELTASHRNKRLVAVLGASLLFFLYLLPINTAIALPRPWVEFLYLQIPGWR